MNFSALLRAVAYKEAVKLRVPWIVLLCCNAAFLAWLFVDVRGLFRFDHPEIVWYRVVGLGQAHYAPARLIPLLSGLVFACMQFLPEMRDERLRLSLHLPVSSGSVVLAHLVAGTAGLAVLYLGDTLFLVWLTFFYFPCEAVNTMLLTFAPWLLAGLTGYLGVTLALLEPMLKLRVFNLALTAGLVMPLLETAPPGAYARALPYFLLIPPLLLLAVQLPAHHFRHRRSAV